MCEGVAMRTCVMLPACAKPVYGQCSLHPPATPLIGVGRRRAPSSAFRAIRDLGPRSAGALKRTRACTPLYKDKQRYKWKD